jgi:hypothetical protein
MQANNHVFAMGLTAAAALLGITVDSLGGHSGEDAAAVQESLRELQKNGSPATVVAIVDNGEFAGVYSNAPGTRIITITKPFDKFEREDAETTTDDSGKEVTAIFQQVDPVVSWYADHAAQLASRRLPGARALTHDKREELIDLLIDDALDDLAQSDEHARAVLEFGNIGYRQMSDTRLLKIHSDRWDEDFLGEHEDDEEEEEES